ncbi:hypothetical protein [Ruminococcus sp. JE7B6]|uniref:hypothetical protein n=1 Tax=Ruminococcus sp. JE7B6 TaxID=3233380 RepID=UPI00389AD53E
MGLNESFETINLDEWFPVLITYAIVLAISIIICRKLINNYKKIPDKCVDARLIKTSDYFGDGETNDGLPSTASYTIAKYEYYINNCRHTIKTKCFDSIPKNITLYYKKGNSDIRVEKTFSLPDKYKILMGVWLILGVTIITIIISWAFGFEVIRKMFE